MNAWTAKITVTYMAYTQLMEVAIFLNVARFNSKYSQLENAYFSIDGLKCRVILQTSI